MRNVIVVLVIVIFVSMMVFGCVERMGINTPHKKNNSIKKNNIPTNNLTVRCITISQIKSNPNKFVGKKVVVHGIYMGWKGNGPPPVTRSDWVIDDGTGRIYVTGIFPNLNPVGDIGRNITVVGYVNVADGIPYIEAIDVKIN